MPLPRSLKSEPFKATSLHGNSGGDLCPIEPIKIDRLDKLHRSDHLPQCESGVLAVTSAGPCNIRDYLLAKSQREESRLWRSCFLTRSLRWSNAFWSTTRRAARACSSRNSSSCPIASRCSTARRGNAAGWSGSAACALAWRSRHLRRPFGLRRGSLLSLRERRLVGG